MIPDTFRLLRVRDHAVSKHDKRPEESLLAHLAHTPIGGEQVLSKQAHRDAWCLTWARALQRQAMRQPAGKGAQ